MQRILGLVSLLFLLKVQTVLAAAYYDCYDTYADLAQKVQQWNAQYPNLVEVSDIGDSWEKQQNRANRDLWVIRLTNEKSNQTKVPVFYVGEHHARELASAQVLIDFIEQELLAKYGRDPTITSLLDTREIYILPMANPDGHVKAEQGFDWRKNTNDSQGNCSSAPPNNIGTDLNRNYGKNWGGTGSSSNYCNATYHGPSVFSEPETQAIRNFITQIRPQIVLSYHSFSNVIIFPWGYTTQHTAHYNQFNNLAQRLAQLTATTSSPSTYGYGQVSEVLYTASGDTIDWFYDRYKLPGFTFEVGSSFWPSCDSYQTIYQKNVKPMIFAAQIANNPWNPPSLTPTPVPTRQPTPSTLTPSPSPTIIASPTPNTTPPPTLTPILTPQPSLVVTPFPQADINEDGKIDSEDVNILIPNWNLPAPFLFPKADLNHDGIINSVDLGIILSQWRKL